MLKLYVIDKENKLIIKHIDKEYKVDDKYKVVKEHKVNKKRKVDKNN